MASSHASHAEQDYLKAVYHLTQHVQATSVGTVALAEWLGVSPPSVTAMVKRLSEHGWVTYTPYHGVVLTADGERVALEMLRHHRLLEMYLNERLGVPWERVHAEADVLEHVLSEDLEARLDESLGHPTADPHGAPIPTKEGRIVQTRSVGLASIAPGTVVEVVEVEDEDADLLQYLADLGLIPGAHVEVVRQAPFGGPLHVRVAGAEHALGERVTRQVFVTPAPSP